MKKLQLCLLILVLILPTACGQSNMPISEEPSNEYSSPENTSDTENSSDSEDNGDESKSDVEEISYRDEMRSFVIQMGEYARTFDPDFLVIPQNGHELFTTDGEIDSPLSPDYLAAIDGFGKEDLFYGNEDDDEASSQERLDRILLFLDLAEENGIEVLTTDYCYTESKVANSYIQNASRGYISFAADRSLDNIPTFPIKPFGENSNHITSLSEAKNFLYILNLRDYDDKEDFIEAVQATNYDLLIMGLFFDDPVLFTASEVAKLKQKANGGTRLVVAYMSIGEAENWHYYWQDSWETNPPEWLAEENPDWEDCYKVKYWHEDWQGIIYGNEDSFLKKIIDSNFDGTYLDIIDAFEYFEEE